MEVKLNLRESIFINLPAPLDFFKLAIGTFGVNALKCVRKCCGLECFEAPLVTGTVARALQLVVVHEGDDGVIKFGNLRANIARKQS